MSPICVLETYNRTKENPYRYGVGWRFPGFIPTTSQLRALGVNRIQGSWPSASGIEADLQRLGFKTGFKPVYDPELDVGRIEPIASDLPMCGSR